MLFAEIVKIFTRIILLKRSKTLAAIDEQWTKKCYESQNSVGMVSRTRYIINHTANVAVSYVQTLSLASEDIGAMFPSFKKYARSGKQSKTAPKSPPQAKIFHVGLAKGLSHTPPGGCGGGSRTWRRNTSVSRFLAAEAPMTPLARSARAVQGGRRGLLPPWI